MGCPRPALVCGGGVEAEVIGYFFSATGVGARGLKLNAGQVSTRQIQMQGRKTVTDSRRRT